jgi:hypothetical protein
VKRHAPDSDFELQVTAKQFNWEVVYPGADRKFDTPDDVKFDNDLHVPVNKVVRYVVEPVFSRGHSLPDTFTSHFEMATEEVAPSYTLSGKCNQSRRSRR